MGLSFVERGLIVCRTANDGLSNVGLSNFKIVCLYTYNQRELAYLNNQIEEEVLIKSET